MTDGPGGPVVIGDPGTAGDMHAEFILFAKPGYDSPEESPAAMTGYAAISSKLIEFGALDGRWQRSLPPFERDGMYFNPLILTAWKKSGDRTAYLQVFEAYNYYMRLKANWRSSGGGRAINKQNTMMQLMRVTPQRPIAQGDLCRDRSPGCGLPKYDVPAGGHNQLLPTRSVACVKIFE